MPTMIIYPEFDGYISYYAGTGAGYYRVTPDEEPPYPIAAPNGIYTEGNGGSGQRSRGFLDFDLSSVPGTITGIALKMVLQAQGPPPFLTFDHPETQLLQFTAEPDTGTWFITYNGNESGELLAIASASEIESNIRGSIPGFERVEVTGDYGIGFTFLFVGVSGDIALLTVTNSTLVDESEVPIDGTFTEIDPGIGGQDTGGTRNKITGMTVKAADFPAIDVVEVQHIAFTVEPDDGDFTLNYNGTDTDPIAFNANAAAVQAALAAIAALSGVNVSGNFTSGFDVTFDGVVGDAPMLTSNSSLLFEENPVAINITETTPGEDNGTDGLYAQIGSANSYNDYVDFNDTPIITLGGTAVADANSNGFLALGVVVDPEYPGDGSFAIWNTYIAQFFSVEDEDEENRPYIEVTYTEEAGESTRRILKAVA